VATKRRPLKLYHGGVPGLLPGEKLQPPSLSGVPSCSRFDSQHCQPDRVYLTTDSEEAAVYAALAPWHGHGDVYEVEPDGVLEPEAISEDGTGSYAAPAATVVAVVRRAIGREEAAARMTAFLLRAAIEGPERPLGSSRWRGNQRRRLRRGRRFRGSLWTGVKPDAGMDVSSFSLVEAIRLGLARADGRIWPAAVRVRVDPADVRDDLLEFFRASSCLGVKQGASEIEVHLLNSVSERHDRAVLVGYVEAWTARHTYASVEIVAG